jgi:AcrR family transcriptional regulator
VSEREEIELAPARVAARRGRPRSEEVQSRILRAAIDLLEERGFRELTIEAIAERAGASKVTLYRWWPGKAALATDAFLGLVAPLTPFGHTESALVDLREQMISQVRVLSGRWGEIIAGLIAEAVIDEEVREAMRTRWLEPRRREARKVVERGLVSGEIRAGADPEVVLDALYAPLYWRLLLGHGPLHEGFARQVWATALFGFATEAARVTLEAELGVARRHETARQLVR